MPTRTAAVSDAATKGESRHQRGRGHRRASRMVAAAGLTTLLLVGCSSGHKSAAPTTTAPTTASPTTIAPTRASPTTAAPTTAAPTTTATSTSPTSAPSGPPQCQPDNLRATVSGQGGAVGHGGEIVTLTLVGDTACTTGGYPGLGLRNAAGGTVPLTVDRQSQAGFLFPYVKPTTIVVTAGTPPSFGIEWINETNLPATTLIVTPPNDFSSIVATGDDSVPENSVVTVTALTTAHLTPPGQP
jgi:hypothetical protein